MANEKLLQKKFYDLLSTRYGLLAIVIGIFIIIVSALQFGEAFLEWSTDKYEAVFNSFSDNIGGKSYQSRICGSVPMDVVYTWVNGSDPRMLKELNAYRDYLDVAHSTESETLKEWCHSCIMSPVLVFKPAILINYSHPIFSNAIDSLLLEGNVTGVIFPDLISASTSFNLTKQFLEGDKGNITGVYQTFMTSDATITNSVLYTHMVALRGFPDSYTVEDIQKAIPEKYKVKSVSLHAEEGLAVLEVSDDETYDGLISSANFTIENKQPTLSAMRLVWRSGGHSRSDDISASRYQDNEELRYSLRSIEKFAPWIRNVYLVTNGQIPSWLNLDNPRLIIVTHEELFLNKSHLPTFSSPAIESHIHRIPGLSNKFIYMNDDVMFGKEVLPDDFYTASHGQKVFLSWPVPNCNDGCPNSWIRDGYCDKPCNNSECEWDGGDCDGSKPANSQLSFNFPGAARISEQVYCHTGCANNWLADRYCDQACNVKQCAFDSGDCGTKNYHHFHEFVLKQENGTLYMARQGEVVVYFNLTTVFEKVTSAEYNENPAIRSAGIVNKYHVFTLVLYEKFNATILNFTLNGIGKENTSLTIMFQVSANTQPVKETALIEVKPQVNGTANQTSKVLVRPTAFVFKDVPNDIQEPKLTRAEVDGKIGNHDVPSNTSLHFLPVDVAGNLSALQRRFYDGDLSSKGFQRYALTLLMQFAQRNGTDLKTLLSKLEPTTVRAILPSTATIGNDAVFKSRQLKSFFDNIGPIEYESPFEAVNVGRKLLDTFGDSLRHVNRLYNKEFGFGSRKVPAHMPHMIDKNIMMTLHDRFPDQWAETSSHKIRSGNDMQFSFSYFYFLMSEPRNISHAEFFDEMDVDKSGVLSDREIRTMATRLFDVPIDLDMLTSIESNFINCSNVNGIQDDAKGLLNEVYYDKNMPQVTKSLFLKCRYITNLVDSSQKGRKKHKYQEVGEDDIAFKMVRTNMSSVVGQLDDVRKNPRKFICLNDNIDHRSEHALTVKNILHDFYEAFFPIPSQFELPSDYKNRFLYVSELKEWKAYRDWLRFGLNFMLCALVIFSITSYFEKEIEHLRKKIFGRRRRKENATLTV